MQNIASSSRSALSHPRNDQSRFTHAYSNTTKSELSQQYHLHLTPHGLDASIGELLKQRQISNIENLPDIQQWILDRTLIGIAQAILPSASNGVTVARTLGT